VGEPSLVFFLEDAESEVGRVAKSSRSRDPLEDVMENVKCAGINEPDSRREWGAVGAVMPEERHESDVYVYSYTAPDPPHYCVVYLLVDVIQVYDKARKEEEEGEM
jgi:hypothetical protein